MTEYIRYTPESPFETLLRTKEEDGWIPAGKESLTQTKFRSEDAKFVPEQYQTESAICQKYLEAAKQKDPSSEFEVDLVLDEETEKLRKFRENSTDEEYRHILTKLRPEDTHYYVFIRRKSRENSREPS